MGGIMPTTHVTSRRYIGNPKHNNGVNDETAAWDSDRGIRAGGAFGPGRDDRYRPGGADGAPAGEGGARATRDRASAEESRRRRDVRRGAGRRDERRGGVSARGD